MCRLLLVDGADVEAVINGNVDGLALVCHIIDQLSPPAFTSQYSLSIGQLFLFFYRQLGGGKCYIFSQEDAITILKMAQMKLGGEANGMNTAVFLEEMQKRFLGRLGEIRFVKDLEDVDPTFGVDHSRTCSPSDFDAVVEFYDTFLVHSKCGDSLEVLELATAAMKDVAGSAEDRLSNVKIVVEVTTLSSLLSSSSPFVQMAASILLNFSSDISLIRGNGPASLSKDETFSLMLSLAEKSCGENKASSINASAATPRSKNPASTPSHKSVLATPVSASRNAGGRGSPEEGLTPRNLRSTPNRILTTSVSPFPLPFSSPISSTETHSRRVIVSYLRLVLNSRDELALARCIDTPNRGLDHDAFTDLRHEAESKGLPMFQCASSFVVRLRLGGKGYQAKEESKLRAHAKGLGELVDLIQRCQNVLEEGDQDAVKSLGKVVNMLKSSIVKARDNRLRVSSVEKAAKTIRDIIPSLWTRLNIFKESGYLSVVDAENKKKIGTQGSKTKELLRILLDEETGTALIAMEGRSGAVLSDAYSSNATPVRFPSLWSQFLSPATGSENFSVDNAGISFASPSLGRKRTNGSDAPLSPLCLNGSKMRNRTPIAFKSSFTWATSDSPPCVVSRGDSTSRLTEGVGGDDGGLCPVAANDGTVVEDADPTFVATQDAVGPTLVMRAKRKRKLDDLFDDARDDGCSEEVGGSTSESIENVPEKGNRGKRSKLAEKTEPSKKGTKNDQKKPKAKRKIIPLPNGQRTLTGFFK